MSSAHEPDLHHMNWGLYGYLLFMSSWLLHLPARMGFLGALRLDLVLVALLAALTLAQKEAGAKAGDGTSSRYLLILVLYALFTIPFVEWPGSVIKNGFPNFVKATVFFYFTISFVRTESDLRKLLAVFLICQTARVLEPLLLHFTEGYWGSSASMEGGSEFMNRLSGGPFDVVNPNGLAYIVCTVLPFLLFLMSKSIFFRLVSCLFIPPLLYALALTGSRSGIIGLVVICVAAVAKSTRPVLFSVSALLVLAIGFGLLSSDLQDRYLSIVGKGERNAATASERIEGMVAQLSVIMHRPVFGHGLGTSAEANYHFTTSGPYVGHALPAHDLYIEVAQELGLVGLPIFLLFQSSVIRSFLRGSGGTAPDQSASPFLSSLKRAMQVWLAMSLVFSFASYGLSSLDWYLFAGISMVLNRLLALNRTGIAPDSSFRPGQSRVTAQHMGVIGKRS